MRKFGNYFVSGDRNGIIQVRDVNQEYKQVWPETFTAKKMEPNGSTVTSIQATHIQGRDIIIAGNRSGFITFIRKIHNENKCVFVQMGAFNDNKEGKTKLVNMFMKDNSLIAIGESGVLRKWNMKWVVA